MTWLAEPEGATKASQMWQVPPGWRQKAAFYRYPIRHSIDDLLQVHLNNPERVQVGRLAFKEYLKSTCFLERLVSHLDFTFVGSIYRTSR